MVRTPHPGVAALIAALLVALAGARLVAPSGGKRPVHVPDVYVAPAGSAPVTVR
jgi:hypothetical protein